MKIPFYTVIGPPIRKNYRTLKKLCSFPLLDISSAYAAFLGILGVGLSLVDMIRIVKNGSVLPCCLWRTRIKSGMIVTPECERDLKLISLFMSFEYYSLLIFGTFTRNGVLFLPWLILYAFIIIGEFTIFVMRLFLDAPNFNKYDLLLSMFVIYNWLAIFCSFYRIIGGCDF